MSTQIANLLTKPTRPQKTGERFALLLMTFAFLLVLFIRIQHIEICGAIYPCDIAAADLPDAEITRILGLVSVTGEPDRTGIFDGIIPQTIECAQFAIYH